MKRSWDIANQCRDYLSMASRMCQIASCRAKSLNLPFDLDEHWLANKISLGVCDATGIEFDFNTKERNYKTNPFRPSIDRHDSSSGYTKDNTRVVVWMYNQAKNEWPIDLFNVMVTAYVQHNQLQRNEKTKLLAEPR